MTLCDSAVFVAETWELAVEAWWEGAHDLGGRGAVCLHLSRGRYDEEGRKGKEERIWRDSGGG